MHQQVELERDLNYSGFIPDALIKQWFEDRYSTSKHLWTLYSVARGLNATTMVEIGFGRSSFVLARAAQENGGKLFSCDTRDFSYLLNETEKNVVHFHLGTSDEFFAGMKEGADMIFLDFLGDRPKENFCKRQIELAMKQIKQNGIIVIHDAFEPSFTLPRVLQKMFRGLSGWIKNRGFSLTVLPYNYGLAIIRRESTSEYGSLTDQFLKKD